MAGRPKELVRTVDTGHKTLIRWGRLAFSVRLIEADEERATGKHEILGFPGLQEPGRRLQLPSRT